MSKLLFRFIIMNHLSLHCCLGLPTGCIVAEAYADSPYAGLIVGGPSVLTIDL